jgi:RNA polymerase sigma factor (sigma-70 family)
MVEKKPITKVTLTDDDLAKRIASGEAALFAVVMKRHNQRLYRIARGMGIPDTECDDILQLTYIQAYLKLPQFRGESAFTTWLTRILINQCLMFLRKERPAVSEQGQLEGVNFGSSTLTASSTPESELLRNELHTILEAAIEQLSDDHRIVYIMREIEDMSIKEISESLGISESNVKIRIHRARKMMQEKLRAYVGRDVYEFGSSRCDAIINEVMRFISVTFA